LPVVRKTQMRSGRYLLGFSVFMALSTGPSSAEVFERKAAVYGIPRANVRESPNLDAPIVTVLKEGDAVMIESENGKWVRVKLPSGAAGYIHSDFLRIDNAKDSQKKEPAVSPEPASISVADIPDRIWIASGSFLLGWFLGGRYFRRRDHIRRTRIEI